MLDCSCLAFVGVPAGRVGEIVGLCTMSGGNASDLIGKSPDRRKLIAVAHADMVGYSRLIGLDDVGTLERLRSLRSQLIDPAIEEHGGRIVQTGGDSLLIVFDSIDGAVRCAMEVQRKVPDYDGEQPPDRAIRFRVGINIGDAIADGTDLHGGAVNVAARIQAACPPGGICVTRAVRDHVQDRLSLAFEELGLLNLKNISRPVEAFVVRFDDATNALKAVERSLVHNTGEALPLPDRPSIAVLAFTNMSGDPDQEYFSDGIADDIITELSRCRWLFVIARNSSFTYRGRAVRVQQVARELGVRYVLEGSVRRSGDQVRLTAQLIEAETGSHIWAERYDRSVNEVFAVQDELTAAVTLAILPAVTNTERQRALRKPPGSLSAWEAYQRGLWHLSKGALVENEQARLLFRRAVKLDRGFAAPHVGLALAYQLDVIAHGVRQPVDAAKLIEAEARTAVEVDPDDSEAHAMLAIAFALTNNQDASRDCAKHALMLNRNSARAFGCRGAQRIFWSGLYEDGRNDLLTALRLDPHSPLAAANLATVAAGYYLEGDYIAAVETARRCLAVYPSIAIARRWLVAGLGQLGRHEEAAVALQALLVVAPDVFNTYVINRLPFITLKSHEHLLEGFRKAGWQG
jgi:adenylate cyclase